MNKYITRQAFTDKKLPTLNKSQLNAGIKMIEKQEAAKNKALNKNVTVKGKLNQDLDDEEMDIEKKKLILKIRQYVFAFEDNKYINEYIGNNKDRWVLSLANKKVPELQNILEYIQFHVRNKGGNDTMVENIITTASVLIEKVGTMAGLQLKGLTHDISLELKDSDSDLKRAVTELAIEMDITKYFNSPKIDVLMILSQKTLFIHQKNKHLATLEREKVIELPQQKPSSEAYLRSSMDEELKNKFADL